jgi:hypothetical protein
MNSEQYLAYKRVKHEKSFNFQAIQNAYSWFCTINPLKGYAALASAHPWQKTPFFG